MALAGDHVQVLVGGYELTGDSNRISISDARDMHDVTVFRDRVHRFIPGQRVMSLVHAGYLNPQVARSHPVLKAANLQGVVSVVLGQNADPAAGDPAFSLLAQQGRYDSRPEANKAVPFGALFANKGEGGGWGVALAVPTSITDSASGSAVDNGAATADGGAVFLHILQAAASDTYTLTVEGSATGAFSGEETTLATFSLDAAALGSERVGISGPMPRYTRWRAVRSGTAGETVTFAVNLVRQ
jgi:hypothetical protein